MLSFLGNLRRNERGNILIIMAAAMPLIVGSAGLATDTIQWALWKRQLQRAADSAAIAGVYERVQGKSTAGVANVVNKDLELNQHTGIDLYENPVLTYPADQGEMTNQVNVVLRVQKRLTFSGMFMATAPIIRAESRAASVPGTDDYCVVSLENTVALGIQGSGSGTVETDCSWITNSVANIAAMAKGASNIVAKVIAAAGGIQESKNFQVDRYDPYVPQIEDPYAGDEYKPLPADMKCTGSALTDATNFSTFYNSSTKVQTKNCFTSLSVGSNKTLTLPSNTTYYINGGGVDIKGTLKCTNCTIVLTNNSTSPTATIGSFNMNASGNMQLSAPVTGKYAGIAIYQDARAKDDMGKAQSGVMPANAPNKINGNSSSWIQGVLYFPKQQLTYNGNGNGAWQCTQFVARRIQFSGNNTTKITSGDTCDGTGVEAIEGGRRVRLVA